MKLVFDIKKAQADAVFDDGNDLVKAGPFIGPRGGKWADLQFKVPWHEKEHAGKPAPKAKENGKERSTSLGRSVLAQMKKRGTDEKHFDKIHANAKKLLASGEHTVKNAADLAHRVHLTIGGRK